MAGIPATRIDKTTNVVEDTTPDLPGLFVSLEKATQEYLDVLEQAVPCGHETPWIPHRYINWGDCKDCRFRVLFNQQQTHQGGWNGGDFICYRRGCVKFAVKQLLNKLQGKEEIE